MLKILIADDHAIVREGLKQILGATPDMVVAGEATSGTEALKMARQAPYDVVLLDISLPGKNGLEVLKQLRLESARMPILMLSMYPEEQYALRALKAGANGYLTKESAPDELITAIGKVSRGSNYVSASLAEKLAAYLGRETNKRPHQLLSDREYQVMLMIASGRTVSEIAQELMLSVKTISTNRARSLQKLGMKSNSEFTYYAVKEGLVP